MFDKGKLSAKSCSAASIVLMTCALAGCAASQPSLLEVVKGYADTMIEHGRDTYGPQKSGLLLSAFDRMALKPLTTRPAPPGGVRRGDRVGPAWMPLVGANPQVDQNQWLLERSPKMEVQERQNVWSLDSANQR